MKKAAKAIFALLLFALVFFLLYADDQKRQLQQVSALPESAGVEITCGGVNHGSICVLTDTDRRTVLEGLSGIEYAPFKQSRVPYDLEKEYFYITVTLPDSGYTERFDIFADAGYGATTSGRITFTVSDDFLALLRSFPLQT